MRSRLRAGLGAAALLVTVAAIYAPVRGHPFVNFDDWVFIVDNPNVPLGLSWNGIRRAVTSPIEAYWLPVTALSFQASYAAHGLWPPGFLLTNVALHALGALLLWLALTRLTGSGAPSVVIAAVFAVHPLHVESVAWATERKDVLAGVFFALTLLAWASYARRPSAVRLGVVTAALTLGLLSKPTLVTVPCVLLLLDFWPLARPRSRRLVLEKLPLLTVAVASSVSTVVLQRRYGAMSFGDAIDLTERLGTAARSWWWYVGKALWPTDLAVFYPYPRSGDVRVDLLAGATLIAMTLAAVAVARRRPWLTVGWLWYVGMLVPAIGLVQAGMQARADRFTYLPLTGLALAVVWEVTERLKARPNAQHVAGVVAAAMLLAFAAVAHAQVAVWQHTIPLFERAIAVTEGNYFAHYRVAEEYRGKGDRELARSHYAAAAAFRPGWAPPEVALGEMALERGDPTAARRHFAAAVAAAPGNLPVVRRLGLLEVDSGDLVSARDHLRAVVTAAPHDTDAQSALGVTLARLGDRAGAVRHLRAAVDRTPEPGWPGNNLAWILATAPEVAIRQPAAAIALAERLADHADPPAAWLDTLATAYAAAGRFDDALAAIARAEARAAAHADAAMMAQLDRHRAQFAAGAALVEPPL
jgi:protein O-mannosyl-transferase